MVDKLTAAERSKNMGRIRSKDTKPEMLVRSLVHRLGYGYRLHRKDLPGKPDLVFAKRMKIIFVHGCFWHGHDAEECPDRRTVKSNTVYWNPKIEGNRARDERHLQALRKAGWEVLTIWECQTRRVAELEPEIVRFLGPTSRATRPSSEFL